MRRQGAVIVWGKAVRGTIGVNRVDVVPSSSVQSPPPFWKIVLAVVSFALAVLIWVSGLISSLTRPSVAPTLSLQQQELTFLAEPSVPPQLRQLLVSADPRGVLLDALQDSPPAQRTSRQELLLMLLEPEPDAEVPVLDDASRDDPLLNRLRCEALGGSAVGCIDPAVAQAAALRLGISVFLPLLSVLLGSGLLLRRLWTLFRGEQTPWPPLQGPALSLLDMVLLVAGGFVVIGAAGVPLVAAPILQALTQGLVSPRREAFGVVINYSVMALPSLLILRRQLSALRGEHGPREGWLQWRLQPPLSAMTSALAGWLMVTPVVMLTGWLLVQLVGDPGGSNPLLELVLNSRDGVALGLLAFTAVVLAPLFEEVIFRGALLPVLAKRLGVRWGIVLSGLLFGLAHISIGELAPLTVLGIGLAILRISSGRLLPCVLMHALWNGITFVNLLLL